jgi:ribosomal protein S18 acetylase RimI-like enzyme
VTTFRATDDWPGLGATLIRARVAVRYAGEDDAGFARQLHHIGRAAEVAPLGWPPALVKHFLDDQYRLRDTHYRANHPAADQFIVTRDTRSIGQMLVDRAPRTWRLIDIALAPEMQGLGFGGALIKWLQRWARRDDADGIDLHVLHSNDRAAALYRHHGFSDALNDSTATHQRLIWRIG